MAHVPCSVWIERLQVLYLVGMLLY